MCDALFDTIGNILAHPPPSISIILNEHSPALFQFDITGKGSWIIELTKQKKNDGSAIGKIYHHVSSSTLSLSRSPDTIFISSEKSFMSLLSGDKSTAFGLMSTGKIKFTGKKQKLFAVIGPLFREVLQNEDSEKILNSKAQGMKFKSKSEWLHDELVNYCGQCEREFNLLRRKHHCRLCGDIFCDKCSSYQFSMKRVCQSCNNKIIQTNKNIKGDIKENIYSERILLSPSLMRNKIKRTILQEEKKCISMTRPPNKNDHNFEELSRLNRNVEHLHKLFHAERKNKSSSIYKNKWMGVFALIIVSLKVPNTFWTNTKKNMVNFGENLHHTWQTFTFHDILHILQYLPFWIRIFFFIIIVVVLSFLCIHLFSSMLFKRRLKVYFLAIRVSIGYVFVKYYIKLFRITDIDATIIYDRTHRIYAPIVYNDILKLQGFWVKVGQYMGSRPDVVPDPWSKELSKLQDAVPPSPFAIVKNIFFQELGESIEEIFSNFSEEPIAAASIAQVHKATLHDGTHVVVKIQHPHIAKTMPQDLINLGTIMSWITWIEPSFDFTPVIDEWSKETVAELDFKNEAQNMKIVSNNLKKGPLGQDIIIPDAIDDMVTQRILVMTFIEGFKVTNVQMLDKYGVDRLALVRKITQAYAQQIYIDGMFNGDPHPGNIMVQVTPTKVYPVLLDFGLTKKLSPRMRIAFGTLVAAAADNDYGNLLKSFDEMGLKLNREDPMQDMLGMQFILRNTGPPKEMRLAAQKWQEKENKKMEELPRGKRNPVDAWPGELLFFIRVTELLSSLCATLRVRLPYLNILEPYAKLALIDKFPLNIHANSLFFPSKILSSLEFEVQKLLKKFYKEGKFVGIQVCVYKDSRLIVNTCAGTMGKTDPRPVCPDTLFNCFSVGKPLASTCVHILSDQKVIDYSSPVSQYWKSFSVKNKSYITVRQLLSHQAGLSRCITPFNISIDDLSNWEKMCSLVASATPENRSEKQAQYHYLSYGWLVGGLCQAASGRHITDILRKDIAGPLGIQDECFFGLSDSISLLERVATLSNGFGVNGAAPSTDDLMRMINSENKTENKIEGEPFEIKSMLNQSKINLLDPCIFNTRRIRQACIPAVNGHFSARSLAKFYAMLCNDGVVPNTSIKILSKRKIRHMFSLQSRQKLPFSEDTIDFGMGVQIFGFRNVKNNGRKLNHGNKFDKDTKKNHPNIRYTGMGHSGLGGSIAFCDPTTSLAVAICVNHLTIDQEVTTSLLDLITRSLCGSVIAHHNSADIMALMEIFRPKGVSN